MASQVPIPTWTDTLDNLRCAPYRLSGVVNAANQRTLLATPIRIASIDQTSLSYVDLHGSATGSTHPRPRRRYCTRRMRT